MSYTTAHNKDSTKIKIALPLFHHRVAPRFDSGSGTIRVIEIRNQRIQQSDDLLFLDVNPLEKMHQLARIGVSIIICGGLTETCAQELEFLNIQVYPWISGDAEEVIKLFLSHKLPKYPVANLPRPQTNG